MDDRVHLGRIGELAVSAAFAAALVAVAAACGADGPEAAGRGEAIYQANCAACHGADLAGSQRGPSLLDPMYAPDRLTDAEISNAIRNGVGSDGEFGDMPAAGGLDDTRIEAIIAYVRGIQGVGTATVP